MPSDPKPARTLLRPGQGFDTQAIPVTRQPARIWFRVHRTGAPALEFGRVPFHRFSHPDCPYPLLYLGLNLATCLWEVFGDDVFKGDRVIALSKWLGRSVSQITVPELKVCAVGTERTREAMGVDKSSLLDDDLSVPQAWGLALQRHPTGFEAIKYPSRFLDRPCLALFDRAGLKSRLRVKPLGGLEDLDAAVDWLHERKVALA